MQVVNVTVQKYLMDFIKKKNLSKGDKLPSERELVAYLEVSRSSVREALHSLSDKGIILKHPGKGTFLQVNPFNDSQDISENLLLMMDITKSLEILEFRKGIEAEIAYLATKRIEKNEIVILEQSIIDMAVCVKTDRSIMIPDIVFHNTLSRSTKNEMFVTVYESIATFIKKVRIEMAIHDDVEVALDYHKKILESVKQGNAELSSQLMRKHIEIVQLHYNNMLRELKVTK